MFQAWANDSILFAGYWRLLGDALDDEGSGVVNLPTGTWPIVHYGTFIASEEYIYLFDKLGYRGHKTYGDYIEPTAEHLTTTWQYRDIVYLSKGWNWIDLKHRSGRTLSLYTATGGDSPDPVGHTHPDETFATLLQLIESYGGPVSTE